MQVYSLELGECQIKENGGSSLSRSLYTYRMYFKND